MLRIRNFGLNSLKNFLSGYWKKSKTRIAQKYFLAMVIKMWMPWQLKYWIVPMVMRPPQTRRDMVFYLFNTFDNATIILGIPGLAIEKSIGERNTKDFLGKNPNL